MGFAALGAVIHSVHVRLAPDIEGQALENLKRLFEEALAKISALSAEVAALRAEIARPKGLKGPPSIKPSGMEQAKSSGGGGKRRRRGAKGVGAAIEDRVVVAEVPPGSRFKGYQTYLVQDLIVRPVAIRYRRERWVRPDGVSVVAPLLEGIDDISGPSCVASCWHNITRARSPFLGW